MQIPTHEFARSLNLHPGNLILYLVDTGCSLEDIWPSIDESWIETVRSKDWARFGPKDSAAPAPPSAPVQELPKLGVSENAGRLIEKLWRKKQWGGDYVSRTSLQHEAHLSSEDLEEAICELLDLNLLEDHGSRYSLNTRKKGDIDRIANRVISRGADNP